MATLRGRVREPSIAVDESGEQQGASQFYLVTLVLHDQSDSLEPFLRGYQEDVARKGLPGCAFHAGPIMNGHEGFSAMDMAQRKRIWSAFSGLVRRLPVSYVTFSYARKEIATIEALASRLVQDLRVFLRMHIEELQQFDTLKVYYGGGQQVVSAALRESLVRVLGRGAVEFRNTSPSQHVLLQAADYFCAVELAALKYERRTQSATDEYSFGGSRQFKKGELKTARVKRLS